MLIQKQTIDKDLIKKPIKGFDANQNVYTERISFPTKYNQPPFVQLTVERLDCGSLIEQSNYNHEGKRLLHTVTRYDVSAQDISESGFTFKISTWNSNTIYGFRVSWIAFGERIPERKSKAEELKDNFLEYLMLEMKKTENARS